MAARPNFTIGAAVAQHGRENANGSETTSAAVFSAVGGVMVATALTAAVGWFAWKRRN
jgi:hypothetical protein